MTKVELIISFSLMISLNCSNCGGQSQFDDSAVVDRVDCPLCGETIKINQTLGELSADEQMALYEESLKDSDWGHQPC